MNREELAELLLAYLYDKAEAEAHSFFFFPLTEFATLAGITDGALLVSAARLLEDAGLVMLSLDFMGQMSALINMEGNSVVEGGGDTGIIAKYRENPRAFLKEDEGPSWLTESEMNIGQLSSEEMVRTQAVRSPETGETAATGEDRKSVIIRIINTILDDGSIDDIMRADLLRDAETLNIQLSKTVKNRTVINSLVAELSSVTSLTHLMAELSCFI